jgi:predicted ArsR family transcriptional regulator
MKIPEDFRELTERILRLLETDRFQSIEQLSNELKIHRTWLAGYLAALENQEIIGFKRIGRAKVYFQPEHRDKR